MTNKYNVQLITDVNGKPMPQYYDETEGVMKPITRDNGEITGEINANVSFPETQNVNGTVSVDNFPQTQQVEVTNRKEVQDVSDAQVKAELEQIKATQAEILERLNGPIDTQVTGSNVGYAQGYKSTNSFQRVGSLAAGTSVVVAEVLEPCILESLMLATDYNTMYLKVENRRADGSYGAGMNLLTTSGNSLAPIGPITLNSIGGENDYWKLFMYNTERDRYMFGMKRSLVFGNGVRISVDNRNDTTHTIGLTCLITSLYKVGVE